MKTFLSFVLLLAVVSLCAAQEKSPGIVNPKAPDGGREIVIENTGRILRNDPRFFEGLKIEDLTIAEPHREYFVGLTNLASGHMLSAATSRSWRYLLMHGTNAVGVATLIADEKNALKFNSFQQPFFPNAMLEALRQAKGLPQTKKQDYELRYLGIPAVNFVAVWLHGESDNILIPLPPTFGRFNDYQPYSESQIIKVLKKDADNVMKQPKLLR
jgi:hypothetical protein